MNFIIPAIKEIKEIKESKESKEKIDITKYIQICENVYQFKSELEDNYCENNIYILYRKACDIKHNNKIKATQLFKKCETLIDGSTDTNIIYEIYVNLALLSSVYKDIVKYYTKTIFTINDRAEPYYYWSIYCNNNNLWEESYSLLSYAIHISYEQAKMKYIGVQSTAYEKYLFEDLVNVCYVLEKYDECIYYLEKMINDKEFDYHKIHLTQMLQSITNKYII